MLEQQLLGAEAQRALAARPSVPAAITRTIDSSSGRVQAGRLHPGAVGGTVEHGAERAPVVDQSGRRAKRAAAPFGIGQRLDRMALGEQGVSVSAAPGVEGSGPTAEVRRTR